MKNKKLIINKNLRTKYYDNTLFYYSKSINDILNINITKNNILYNDLLIFDNIDKVIMRRYYSKDESYIRLNNYTLQYSKLDLPYFCNFAKIFFYKIMIKREHKHYKYHNRLLNNSNDIDLKKYSQNNEILNNLNEKSEYIEDISIFNNLIKVNKIKINTNIINTNKLFYNKKLHNIYNPEFSSDNSYFGSLDSNLSDSYFENDMSNIKLKFKSKKDNINSILNSRIESIINESYNFKNIKKILKNQNNPIKYNFKKKPKKNITKKK